MTPNGTPRRNPETVAEDTVLVRFEMTMVPGDTPFPGRERRGRPDRSPSLPPEEPPPAGGPAGSTPPANPAG
jgi:hypothetical protein